MFKRMAEFGPDSGGRVKVGARPRVPRAVPSAPGTSAGTPGGDPGRRSLGESRPSSCRPLHGGVPAASGDRDPGRARPEDPPERRCAEPGATAGGARSGRVPLPPRRRVPHGRPDGGSGRLRPSAVSPVAGGFALKRSRPRLHRCRGSAGCFLVASASRRVCVVVITPCTRPSCAACFCPTRSGRAPEPRGLLDGREGRGRRARGPGASSPRPLPRLRGVLGWRGTYQRAETRGWERLRDAPSL